MSKKLMSFVLLLAMMMTVFCCGVGDVGMNASAQDDDFTYYFLAPDNWCNVDKGAANSDVGVFWWKGPADRLPVWPGVKMESAPEVGKNVFKAKVPNDSEIICVVFNAYVDAGAPQDPELAKVAHQTIDVDVEENNYDGMIYVLDLNANQTSGEYSSVIPEKGNWFKLDDYKKSNNYKTYKFDENEPTPPKTTSVMEGNADYIVYNSDNTAILVKYYNVGKVAAVPEKIGDAKVIIIGAEAFKNCTQLETVIVSENVTAIENSAFDNCPNLKEVYLSNSVAEISKDAFKSNENVKIFAPKGSYAALYALENDIPFIDVNAVFGDMDGDKNITSADSLLILRRSVNLESFTDSQKFFADVDGDGNITSADALEVLRSSVSLPTQTKTGKLHQRAA